VDVEPAALEFCRRRHRARVLLWCWAMDGALNLRA
jgi:hypothetical protein